LASRIAVQWVDEAGPSFRRSIAEKMQLLHPSFFVNVGIHAAGDGVSLLPRLIR
jgi:hypothetical protein